METSSPKISRRTTRACRWKKKLQQKIAKFDRHLAHFPADTVHLQIVLEKHPRKRSLPPFRVPSLCALPSDILHAEEAGARSHWGRSMTQ